MLHTPTGLSRLSKFLPLAILLLVGISSCDNPTTDVTAQQVEEVAWLPNHEMLALVDRITSSNTTGVNTVAYDLVHVSADGTLGNRIPASERSEPGLVPTLVTARNGSEAITQIGTTIYRVDVAGSSATAILHGNLLAVSKDLQYILVTGSGAGATAKDCSVYDITSATPRQVSQFFVTGASNSHALWLDAGRFAMSVYDSGNYSHVNVYDTLAHIVDVITDAEVALHASAYSPVTHELFFRNSTSYIGSYNLETKSRSTIRSQRVSSFDVDPSGQLAVFVMENDSDISKSKLYAMNIETTATAELATGALAVILSPDATRVAYSHFANDITTDIHVTSVTKP